jgi:hypothetical protein
MPLVEELAEPRLELRWHREQRMGSSGRGVGVVELVVLVEEVELVLMFADMLF